MIHSPKLQAIFGLKFNPFLPEVPDDALYAPAGVEHFVARCESYLPEGGFVMLTGAPGQGKSVALRLLETRLSRLRDVLVRSLTYPKCRLGDFYRELGEAFGIPLNGNNRWGAFKAMREKWQAHLETTHMRPVLIIDEAQDLLPQVLGELRLLASRHFDSQTLLFVVLVGDAQLIEKLRTPELLPLESRLRVRARLDLASVADLSACLRHVVDAAGNAQLFPPPLIAALAEHSAGNYRTMMSLANDLLHAAVDRDLRKIDEKLFFELATPRTAPASKPRRR
jgi:type II secretory pathway predicted ATPase ExeA